MNNDTIEQVLSIPDLQYLKSVFSDFDGSFKLIWDDSEKDETVNHQGAIVVSNYTKLKSSQLPVKGNTLSDLSEVGELFESYVKQLQLGAIKDIHTSELTEYFLLNGGIIDMIIGQQYYDKKLSNCLVKLHDIISNAIPGNIEVNYLKPANIARRVMSSLLFCHLIICLKELRTDKMQEHIENYYVFFAPTLTSAIKNYNYYEDIIKDYVHALIKLSKPENMNLPAYIDNSNLILHFNSIDKETFFRSILSYSESSRMAQCVINKLTTESKDVLFKLVLSRVSFHGIGIYRRLVCVLNRLSVQSNETIGAMLIKVMQAWADPIIARAHVTAEIIHYTHLVFVLFYHLASNKNILQKYQNKIVEQLAKGLPNHLNSTDYRTISLAKMMCELITESLKFHTGSGTDETLNEKFIETLAENDLCQDVLMGYHKDCCKEASSFWMYKYSVSQINIHCPGSSKMAKSSTEQEGNIVDSDDDEDDLQPIESMDVPDHDQKTKIVYIRDFLEKLPEIKTYDETATVLRNLPNVIKYQLVFDHEQVGKDLLDAVFRWENDFDQPILDEYRKTNLCTILRTKTEGNVDHFCKYFHGITQLQPYKKNLILDVLSTVSKELPLKQLEVLANSAFNHILYDENCIKTQDVTVKIPLILFFSNILSNTLPRVMVKEQMVISYLKCLTQIENESSSTEQTALYAIHNLVGSLEGFQFSETVQESISDTRTWLCRLKNMEINHL